MTKNQEHADLINLRLWIHRVASDYEKAHPRRWDGRRHKKNLKLICQATEGAPKGSAIDALRGLIATGVIQHKRSNQEIPEEALPETLMLDFTVDALWPIVIARKLPESWLDSLAKLTSPQLASLVSSARAVKTSRVRAPKTSMDKQEFYSEIAQTPFADGVLNLLKDLNNPRGGGSYLATVAIADGFGPPRKGSTPKNLLHWLAGAAAGGVIGNKTDTYIGHLWDWLTENTSADGSPSSGGSCVTDTSDPGTPPVPTNGASATTGIGTSTPNAFPAAGAGRWARIIGAKGTTTAAAVGAVAAAGAAAIAIAGVGPQASPVIIPGPGVMTVSQAPGPVAPSGTSGTASTMPTAVNPTTVNNTAPSLTKGPSSPPPATTTPLPATSPPTSGTPASSDPPVVSAQPYDMTGTWLLQFTRNNFGGAMKGVMDPYTITLKRLDDPKCVSVSPCYSGRWYHVNAKAYEGANFIVTASRSTSGVINLSGTEVDYAQYGPQRYEGTAPNDASSFTGTWTQHAPSDDNKNERTATFTLTRQP
jgi:hypothetical protein